MVLINIEMTLYGNGKWQMLTGIWEMDIETFYNGYIRVLRYGADMISL